MSSPPARPLAVVCNYFRVELRSAVFKYDVVVERAEPLTPEQYRELARKYVTRTAASRLLVQEALGRHFVLLNGAVYSASALAAPLELPAAAPEDAGVRVALVQSRVLDPRAPADAEALRQLAGRLCKGLLGLLRLKRVGRRLFDPAAAQALGGYEVWPGFDAALGAGPAGALLNLDIASKLVTNVPVLAAVRKALAQGTHDAEAALDAQLGGKVVMTRYNRLFYTVEKVCLDMSPRDSFTDERGEARTFLQYYEARYGARVDDPTQPLLRCVDRRRRRGRPGEPEPPARAVFLLPEFCCLTGLAEGDRANFNFMRDLDRLVKPDPAPRLGRSVELLQKLADTPAPAAFLAEWNMQIDKTPVQIDAARIDAGNLLFGDNKNVNIESCQNLDRDTQQKAFVNKSFQELIIFYPSEHLNEFKSFFDLTKTIFQQFAIPCEKLRQVEVQNMRNFGNVKSLIEANLKPGVTACIWILPGPKKAGVQYDNIKRLLVNHIPVPSQMIIARTIGANKNLRSIITKLYVQLCAKIGGVPWAINQLPFAESPTMVVGVDVCANKVGSAIKSFSLVATMNNTYTTYWSASGFDSPQTPLATFLAAKFHDAVAEFERINKIAPFNIIIFRDDVSRGQRNETRSTEIGAIRAALAKAYDETFAKKYDMASIVFVTVSKSCSAKFFYSPSGNPDPKAVQNPLQGTYVCKTVCEDENDFYVVPQKTLRGLSSPVNFYLLENDLTAVKNRSVQEVRDLVAKLAYKLSFLYYNTSGAIKSPAPLHYAQKLSTMVKEKSTQDQKILPHPHLASIRSLYFI